MAWGEKGRFGAPPILHNGGVIKLENPYIGGHLWVSLGVIKLINWSYGPPLAIVEANDLVW